MVMTQPFNTQQPATPPQPPYGMAPQAPTPKKKAKKWPWIVGGVAVLAVIGMVNSGNSDSTNTTTAAPASLPSYTTPAAPPVVDVTLPEVAGKNGQIALDELKALGLTAVTPASQDRNDSMVLLPANWTVTKIEPAARTVVKSNSTVIVTMTKRGAAATPAAPAQPAGPQTSGITDGSYHVGDDIEPGTYKSAGGDGRPCYWARYKNGSSEFSNIITNSLNDGPARVTVKAGELFEVQGCQPFEKVG